MDGEDLVLNAAEPEPEPEPEPEAAPVDGAPVKPAYKRPESVLVVVATRGGEVLLLRRTQPADFWQSVTGSLRGGEYPRQAALRELREETGIETGSALIDLGHVAVFPIVPPWRERYAPSERYNREHWFGLWLPGRRLIRRNRDEHSEHRWYPWPEAARRASSWTNRDAIAGLFGAVAR